MVTLTLTHDQCVVIDMYLNGYPTNDERGARISTLLHEAVLDAGEEELPEPWEYED